MSEERETRIIVISPRSDITPDQIARTIHSFGKDVTVKESCYGSVMEGPRKDVREVLQKIREIEPNAIFSKVRAYPVGDPRRCRAHHGTRPGFAQIEQEWSELSKIQAALDSSKKGERTEERAKKGKLPINEFKKICEVYE